MILWGLMAGFLAAFTPQDPPGQGVVHMTRVAPPNGVQRCLRQMRGGVSVSIRMTCRVNAIAGPSSCTYEPEDLGRAERYAAMCISRPYQFRYADGRPATGRTVTYTLHLSTDPLSEPQD
jgi:hypothetical protein